jgi:surface polysaccharide O-acyltransferase-like enzyme
MKGDKYVFALDVIRALAISGVVAIHVAYAVGGRPDFFGGISWYFAIILNSISRSAIPLFIMISGYLILSKNESFNKTIQRILTRIVVPLLFWTFIYALWSYSDTLSISSILYSLPLQIFNVNVFHFYYLIITIGLYVFSPLIRNYLNGKNAKKQIIFTGLLLFLTMSIVLLQYIFQLCNVNNMAIMWIPYVGLFVAGYTLGHNKISVRPYILYSLFLLSLGITIALNYYYYFELFKYNTTILNSDGCISHYTDYYLSINVVLMAIPLFLILLNKKYTSIQKSFLGPVIKSIAKMSFGIFLTHLLILQALDKLHIFDSLHPMWLFIIIRWIVVFVLSYLLTALLIKIPLIKKTLGEK